MPPLVPKHKASRSRTAVSHAGRARSKCGEERPSCRRCIASQLECQWLQSASKPRGKGACYKPVLQIKSNPPILPRSPMSGLTGSSLPNSLFLSTQDREYLAFYPHSSLIRWFGKPGRWSSLCYLQTDIAPHSCVVMRMVLAIAATELESLRLAQRESLQGPRSPVVSHLKTGASYYHRALQDFQALLASRRCFSAWEVNEILAAFLLMVVYEFHFSFDRAGVDIHIRGVYAFLRTLDTQQAPDLPRLSSNLPHFSQQIVLIIMYIHIIQCHRDFSTSTFWEEAGHERPILMVLDDLFQGSRNTNLSLWSSDYPIDQLMDDMSIFRPLEFSTSAISSSMN